MNAAERRSRQKMAVAVENRDLKRDAAVVQNLRRRAPRGLRDQCRDVEAFRAGEVQNFPGAIRGFRMRDDVDTGAGFRAARREPRKIDFATARMEVEKALAELGHFGEAAGDRHFGDLVLAQIFQHAADKIAHLDQRDVRHSMQRLDRRFRGRAGRSGDMGEPGRAGDIDPAMNRIDPCGAGKRHDNPCRAQDREAANDAEPGIERSLGDFFAAWNRDFDGRISGKTIDARHLADHGFDHPAGRRIDRRFSRGQRQARAGNGAYSLSGAKHHARSGRAVRHARDHQRAMRHVGIVARVLDDSRACKPLAELFQGQRKRRPRAARQGDRDGTGKLAANERLIGRPRGGGGAGAGRPALAQMSPSGTGAPRGRSLERKRLLVKRAGDDGNILARGLVIAAPRSGSGKTILTLGLMRSYRNAGLTVAGAKCGPDYIDGAFHAAATGKPSFNLDSWAMRPTLLTELAVAAGEACELILCEGVMGLFDGVAGEPGRTGSSADVAAALGWPVLLVIDASGQSQTAAAIVSGCASFDPRIKIAGVVLNRVASPRHRQLVSASIEALGIPVLGALPRDEKIHLPERHLGLVQAGETSGLDAALDKIAGFIEEHVDTGAILSCARASPALACGGSPALPPPAQRIAIARDEAFSFLYPHILAGWRNAGAEIAFFSPLADEPPPGHCDLCWLPGGYPELHAGRLAAAARFLAGLRRFAETRPAHGECGGYMILGQSLTDAAGHAHRMAGLLDASFSFARRKLHLGYRQARLAEVHPLGAKGALLRGHEFHYATLELGSSRDKAFALVRDAYGGTEQAEGNRRGNVSGSFFHVIAAEETGVSSARSFPSTSGWRPFGMRSPSSGH